MTRSSTERLVSAVRHFYGGRWVLPGDLFEVAQRDVEQLVKARYARRDLTLSTATVELPRRRTYQRRDLKAEE